MKLFIFTITLLLSNLIGFAQTVTCPTTLKRNNGNGNGCTQGSLLLYYTTCPTNLQVIDSVYINGALSKEQYGNPDAIDCASKGYVKYCITTVNTPPVSTWTIYFRDSVTNTKYTCIVSNTTILPINIKTFTAVRQKDNVQLSWETSLETNGQAFIIERKTGNDFVTVATIAAKNIESGSAYSFIDVNDYKGVSEYRLKVVCKDVSAKYSDIKMVKGVGNIDFTIFPNPASGNTKISISDVNKSSNIQVIDNSGRVVKKLSFKTSNTIEINDLQRGIYRIQLMDVNSGETITKTLTLF